MVLIIALHLLTVSYIIIVSPTVVRSHLEHGFAVFRISGCFNQRLGEGGLLLAILNPDARPPLAIEHISRCPPERARPPSRWSSSPPAIFPFSVSLVPLAASRRRYRA